MTFTLVPITSATAFIPLIRALYAAQDDPPVGLLQLVTPLLGTGPIAREDSIQMSACRLWFLHSCDPGSTWLSVVDDETGEVVAGSWWTIAEASPSPSSSDRADEGAHKPITSYDDPFWLPEGSELRRYARLVFAELESLRDGGGRKRLVLQIMFTHPKFRRRGAARMLMEWGTALADRLGLEIWMQARPMAKPLYLQHGFEVVEEVLVVPVVDVVEKTDEWRRLEERYRSVTLVMYRSARVGKE